MHWEQRTYQLIVDIIRKIPVLFKMHQTEITDMKKILGGLF